jgi:putative spermidine/putrescine transport system ATP-binding protein
MTDSPRGTPVQLTDLRRSYGGVAALDGLTLHMEPGEFVALLGPSGCGKTTALRCLAGLEDPDAGTIVVGGNDLTKVPTNKRDMGMVFQAYSLFPHMTARQNVEFGLELRGRDKAARRARAAEMLDLVGLVEHADKFAHQMSGGQQQRVALARALAIEPQVLLLDEPLSALDAKVRTQLRDEIRRIQLEVGTTTLFVTHDQEEALAVADRVGVMSVGKLEQLAPPAELYSAPKTPFVADFVGGSVPLLPGSSSGPSALVLVRPEGVRIAHDDGGTASVVSASFLGGHGRVIARIPDGTLVTVQVPNTDVTTFRPGDRVTLSPRGDAALAVAD